MGAALREKCPDTEFYLVRIFPHSDWIRRDAEYLCVFSPNAGKYGPQKTPHLDIFYAVFNKANISEAFQLTHNIYQCYENPYAERTQMEKFVDLTIITKFNRSAIALYLAFFPQ